MTVSQKSSKRGAAAAEAPLSLGAALEEHIAGWIRRVERTGHWTRRSDIYDRLMAEIEKIVIRAALEKTGFVQTDAADFLRDQPQHAGAEDSGLRHPPRPLSPG